MMITTGTFKVINSQYFLLLRRHFLSLYTFSITSLITVPLLSPSPQSQTYLLDLLIPLYESVGFDDNLNDPHLDQYKRVKALSWACNLGYQDCVDNSQNLFNTWVQNPSNTRWEAFRV